MAGRESSHMSEFANSAGDERDSEFISEPHCRRCPSLCPAPCSKREAGSRTACSPDTAHLLQERERPIAYLIPPSNRQASCLHSAFRPLPLSPGPFFPVRAKKLLTPLEVLD